MRHFRFIDGVLHAEGVGLAALAQRIGTPVYVYSRAAIEQQWQAYAASLAADRHLICYAVKANGNIAILNLLARLGSGFDIVSGGELQRVLKAGGQADKIVFSGVGKSSAELRQALTVGIKCFNVESISELRRLNAIAAELAVTAPVSLRVNPDVDAATHPYIATGLRDNKFGLECSAALEAYRMAADLAHIKPCGIACHIGSQITSLSPYADALAKVMALLDGIEQAGIVIEHIDIGGGLGVQYDAEQPPAPADLGRLIAAHIPPRYHVLLEPGRSIVGNAGVLLTRLEYIKTNHDKHFAVVDAGMNDLLRPCLYQAWQRILPVTETDGEERLWEIVGPVCESADFLGLQRRLALADGALLAVFSAGAYGFVMSSNYNSRPRAAEVLVDGEQIFVIRAREDIADLFRGEQLLPY